MPSTNALFDKLMHEARGLFPQWDEPELHKWVHARLYAAKCLNRLSAEGKDHFGKRMPMTEPQVTPFLQQFAARTTREAGFR